MAIEILNRWTSAVIYKSDTATTLRDAVVEAVEKRVSLVCASLDGASLVGAGLRNAILDGAGLRNASLFGAILDGASLRNAILDGASLVGASLRNASLVGASGINHLLVCDLAFLRDQGEVTAYKLVTANMCSPMCGFCGTPIQYEIGKEYSCNEPNEDETQLCASGLHVATMAWCLRNWQPGWRLLRVPHAGEDIAAIPTATDGKWRVRSFRVIDEVPLAECGDGPWSKAANGK